MLTYNIYNTQSVCFTNTHMYSVPVSCGDGRVIQDRRKDTVCVFDAVFHPDTIHQALINHSLKQTICLLAIHKINEKLKINSAKNKSGATCTNPIISVSKN